MSGTFKTSAYFGGMVLLLCLAGCGGGQNAISSPPSSGSGPQTYFAPYIAGTTNAGSSLRGPEIYSIDDSASPKAFSQENFSLNPQQGQQGAQVINTGTFTATSRGLLTLGITSNYTPGGNGFTATNFPQPKTGSFAVELAGQAGGLVQLVGQPAAPLVAAVQCPSAASKATYLFITIPSALINSTPNGQQTPFGSWNPHTDTAYGSVDVSASGTNVTFSNIQQVTLDSIRSGLSPVSGTCAPTVLGNTTSAPGQVVVQNPGTSTNPPPQATIGIGPSGLLVEDNGAEASADLDAQYANVLGAGSGAIGLPQPSSAVDTKAVRGAQYLGFIYGSGSQSTDWSSHVASFGFPGSPALPSACSSFVAQTGPLVNGIYGGDYPQTNGQDDPSASPDGFANCDVAIDFGTQASSTNGLYPAATVWLGANYVGNKTGKTYSFPVVAIAGQLNGKYAIFLIGVDSTQPWTIYLLQSN